MKRNIESIDNCFGCFLCEAVCPKKCIQKTKTLDGFYLPTVINDSCIECGKCLSTCPIRQEWGNKPLEIMGVRHNDSSVLKNSTSGGAFTAITDWIIKNDGVVFGATFDNEYTVVHTCASDYEGRDRMRGAKYVKSDTIGVYGQVEEILKSGKYVLFSGTPCQVAAMNSFCKSKQLPREQLFTVDLICHGTPSPGIFADYIRILKKKYGPLVSYTFRDKEIGWHGQNVTARFESGKMVRTGFVKYFGALYSRSYITMDSCSSCKYASFSRVGDITLGDFWGVEKHYSNYSDNQGVSLVMINSERGKLLFDRVKENLNYWQTTENECVQPNLVAPSTANKHKKIFHKIYNFTGLRIAYYSTVVFQFMDDVRSKVKQITKK